MPEGLSPYRPEFEAALRVFGRVSEGMRAAGHLPPVLVGGGAIELYSASAITTGDFDVVTSRQDVFEAVLLDHGFSRLPGSGHVAGGWIHAELRLGFEVVGDSLLDGNADRARIRLIDLGADGRIAVISLEDVIADRMGQYASGTAVEMRDQARALYRLYPDADLDYMDRRIREETSGDHGIESLHP